MAIRAGPAVGLNLVSDAQTQTGGTVPILCKAYGGQFSLWWLLLIHEPIISVHIRCQQHPVLLHVPNLSGKHKMVLELSDTLLYSKSTLMLTTYETKVTYTRMRYHLLQVRPKCPILTPTLHVP